VVRLAEHLQRILRDYVSYFNIERPHQDVQQRIPDRTEGSVPSRASEGGCTLCRCSADCTTRTDEWRKAASRVHGRPNQPPQLADVTRYGVAEYLAYPASEGHV
jgi:hypothetical protein